SSSLSTIPVTFEASQTSASASVFIGMGRAGSRTRSACPWAGVKSNSAQTATHQLRVANRNSTSVGQNASGLASFSFIEFPIMSKSLIVDSLKYCDVRLWRSSNDPFNQIRNPGAVARARGLRLQETG